MATSNERLNLIISAKDQATSTLNSLKNQIVGIGAAYLAWGTVKDIIGGIVSAGMESEKTWNDVTAALKRHDLEVDNNIKRIQQFSNQMRDMSGISDEVVGKSVQEFIDYGQSVGGAMNTVRVAMDLAAGAGMDFGAATDLLAKASVGYTATLSRYGIIIDESIPKSEKFAAAIEQINKRFGGAATAQMDMAAVKLNVLKEKWGDLQEVLAEDIMGPMSTGMSIASGFLQGLTWRMMDAQDQAPNTKEEIKHLQSEIMRLSEIGAPTEKIEELKNKLKELEEQAANSAKELRQHNQDSEDFGTGLSAIAGIVGDFAMTHIEGMANELKRFFETPRGNLVDNLYESITAMGTATRIAKEFQGAFAIKSEPETSGIMEQDYARQAELTELAAQMTFASWAATRTELEVYYARQAELTELAAQMTLASWAATTTELAELTELAAQMTFASWSETSKEIDAQAAKEKAAVDKFANGCGAILGNFVDSSVDALVEGRGNIADIWQDMAQDFMKYFIKEALKMLLNMLIPGMGSILGSIFDTPANDLMAMTQGQHFAGYFIRGALETLEAASLGTEILVRTSPFASPYATAAAMNTPIVTHTSPSSMTSMMSSHPITVNFFGPVTSESFVKDVIVPAIEKLKENNFSRIALDDKMRTGFADVEFA